MLAYGSLHLGRANAMPGDVKHIVDSTGDPIISILITSGPVTRQIVARIGVKIGLSKAFMISVNGTHDARPRRAYAEGAARWISLDFIPCLVQ